MFGIIKKAFIVLLRNIVNESENTKCVSLSNQERINQPTLINLHPNEYSQEFHFDPFAVKWDRCVEGCNTLNHLSNKVCVPNKTEHSNLNVFNMITGMNELKTLTKHISCKCKKRFDRRKFYSNQWWNNDKYQCENRIHHLCKKDYVWNPPTCSCKNGKNLASIMHESAIMCDDVIEP